MKTLLLVLITLFAAAPDWKTIGWGLGIIVVYLIVHGLWYLLTWPTPPKIVKVKEEKPKKEIPPEKVEAIKADINMRFHRTHLKQIKKDEST